MYLRPNRRFKDGKEHRYWSIVESKRCAGGKVVQRQVLYLGEINDSQHEAWCRVIEAFDEEAQQSRQLALFPADRIMPGHAVEYGVQVRLGRCSCTGRGNGGLLAGLPAFTSSSSSIGSGRRACPTRAEGTRWSHILQTLACYRLIDPGSEWRLQPAVVRAERHGRPPRRGFFAGREERPLIGASTSSSTTSGAVLASAPALAGPVRRPLRCAALRLDQHHFESDRPTTRPTSAATATAATSAATASGGHRVIVTPEGFPLAYEVLPGNTSDKTTLRAFLARIEAQYGKGAPDLVVWIGAFRPKTRWPGSPGRSARLLSGGNPQGAAQQAGEGLIGLPWQAVRPGVDVKLLAKDDELYVLAQSRARIDKERAMRRGS